MSRVLDTEQLYKFNKFHIQLQCFINVITIEPINVSSDSEAAALLTLATDTAMRNGCQISGEMLHLEILS